ncbi:MAG: archaeosortase A [Methanosarcinales archaeon]|nr:archaeosortase A [Methanosarcinales archaeon]
MTNYFLWMSLVFFLLASILPSQHKQYRMPIGSIGWIFFAIYWALQPLYYIKEGDLSMILLTLVVAFICIIIAHLMFGTYLDSRKGIQSDNHTDRQKTLTSVTTITAVGCLFYFPFAEIESLNHFLISIVTSQTFWLAQIAGFPVERLDWNMIILEGYRVEIILACTAIESIALFFGIILGIKAEKKRIFMALMASIPVIYILNLIRNAFVIGAYGYNWFGTGPMTVNILGNELFLHDSASFYLGHHIIAKAGSGIALFFIAYAVLKLLPELLDLIDNLWQLIREDLRLIRRG